MEPVFESYIKIKQQRIKIALAAYAYECTLSTIMSDAVYDVLAIEVENNKHIATDNSKLDAFFRYEFSPYTGMWVRKHPDFLDNRLENFLDRYLIILKRWEMI